jgi:cell division protein FtsI/penicillin-binding protein 2
LLNVRKKTVNAPTQEEMDSLKGKDDSIGRRRFIKSLFGLGAVSEASEAADAKAPAKRDSVSFFWANLRNGQIGFPTGMSVPSGPPGSVMKLITAAALREANVVTDNTTVDCRGCVVLRGQSYSCLYPHGNVDLTKAIGLSCNVFFATMSQKLSSSAILDYAARFGFSRPVAGFPSGKFPERPQVDSIPYALGLAEDLQPNALQLLRVAALIGLKGKTPPLHNAVDEPKDSDVIELELQPTTWRILQQGMRMSGRDGTAKALDPEDKLKGAYKTGTAPHGKTYQSWIIGFFPYDQPNHAFALRAGAGTSQDKAVPEARKFLLSQTWP